MRQVELQLAPIVVKQDRRDRTISRHLAPARPDDARPRPGMLVGMSSISAPTITCPGHALGRNVPLAFLEVPYHHFPP